MRKKTEKAIRDEFTENRGGGSTLIQSLTVRNVALIEEAHIDFHSGMHALTGETGAGKSIVVDSVNLILGGRADRELIRSGCEKATVEAVFDADHPDVAGFMARENIEYDGSNVVIYREISSGGRNICRICGVVVTLNALRELAGMLMDLHGQSENLFLVNPELHLPYLDQTGDEHHRQALQDVAKKYSAFISNHRDYAHLVKQKEQKDFRMAALEKELEVLRALNLKPGELERIREETRRLEQAEGIAGGLREAYAALTEEENESSLLTRLKSAGGFLQAIRDQNQRWKELGSKCDNVYYELEEIIYELSQTMEKLDFDPVRLEKLQSRLENVRKLEKKYGVQGDALCSVLEEKEDEYRRLESIDDRVKEMSREHKKLLAEYRQAARILTESRKALAVRFEQSMTRELKELGMENTRFHVAFAEKPDDKPIMPSENGDDKAEFLISPNPGEPLKPLARIASGGELSRLMLAIKSLEADRTGVQSMVFDEIDTGISGRMAQVVAEKMIHLSRTRQVICVTHLPQIAAAADHEYLVRKQTDGERTRTFVTELDRKGRIAEIGRMISGANGLDPQAESYAENMIASAEDKRRTETRCTG